MLQAGYIHVCTCTHVGSLSVGVHSHPVEIYIVFLITSPKHAHRLRCVRNCVLLQLKMNFDVVR